MTAQIFLIKYVIRNWFDNFLSFQVAKSGPNQGYFVDPDVLDRVPNLLLILSGIYASMGMLSVYLIRQPADDWVEKKIRLGEQKAAKAIRVSATTTATTTAALVNQPSNNGLPISEELSHKSSPTKQVRILFWQKLTLKYETRSYDSRKFELTFFLI